MPIGIFPEDLSQRILAGRILVGRILVGRLGVPLRGRGLSRMRLSRHPLAVGRTNKGVSKPTVYIFPNFLEIEENDKPQFHLPPLLVALTQVRCPEFAGGTDVIIVSPYLRTSHVGGVFDINMFHLHVKPGGFVWTLQWVTSTNKCEKHLHE